MNRIKTLLWRLKIFLFKRYDIVRCKTLKSNVFYESDTRLLHSAFQCLVDWVEKSRGFEWWSPGGIQEHETAYKELERLYFWWKEVRPKSQKLLDEHFTCELEDILWQEEQQNLKSLVELRGHLWT